MASKKYTWHQVSQKEFETVKALQAAGLSVSKTGKIVGRGAGTVASIYKADTLEAHKEASRATRYAYKNKPLTIAGFPVEAEPVVVEEVEPVGEVTATLADVVDVLQDINTSLTRLADAWENTGNKKGFLR
jgi:hypothetical protein